MVFVILGALAIGLSLGLMGSGGSILTVPILVYLVGQPEKAAIAGSLLVVGSIAFVGALQNMRRGTVHWRSVLWFGIPGMVGTWFGAQLSALVSGTVQMVVFDLVMLAAALLMLRSRPPENRNGEQGNPGNEPPQPKAHWRILLDGLLVGLLTGFVGVGGGFMVVPALVLLGGLTMRVAIGTSLLIIAMKSFSGFAKYLDVLREMEIGLDYSVLAWFAGVGTVGSLIGGAASARIPQNVLQRVFAILLLVAGLAILGALLIP